MHRVEDRVCFKKIPLHWVPDDLERSCQESSESVGQIARGEGVRSDGGQGEVAGNVCGGNGSISRS